MLYEPCKLRCKGKQRSISHAIPSTRTRRFHRIAIWAQWQGRRLAFASVCVCSYLWRENKRNIHNIYETKGIKEKWRDWNWLEVVKTKETADCLWVAKLNTNTLWRCEHWVLSTEAWGRDISKQFWKTRAHIIYPSCHTSGYGQCRRGKCPGRLLQKSVQTLLLLRCTDQFDFTEDIVYVAYLNKTFVEII